MRKAFIIFFAIIYLLPAIGLTVLYHFCGGTLMSTSIAVIESGKEPADCCGEEQEDDTCCKTQLKSIKFDDLHFASAKIELNKLTLDIINYPTNSNNLFISNDELNSSINYPTSPPGNLTYLNNRVLRI